MLSSCDCHGYPVHDPRHHPNSLARFRQVVTSGTGCQHADTLTVTTDLPVSLGPMQRSGRGAQSDRRSARGRIDRRAGRLQVGTNALSVRLRSGSCVEPYEVPYAAMEHYNPWQQLLCSSSVRAFNDVRCPFLAAQWRAHVVRVGQTIPRKGSSSPRPHAVSSPHKHSDCGGTRFVRIRLSSKR